jgi:tRNA pseudouridine55 synthase
MNEKQLNIYKPLGKTAYEMIELLRAKQPQYANLKLSYAGRLDPMAHGVLILLVGEDENKSRRDREKSDKVYEFTCIFGIKSDTFDICGLPTIQGNLPTLNDIEKSLPHFTGKIMQKIPIYSAYRVRGKPMYVLASQGKLKDEDVPTIEREIFKIEILESYTLQASELLVEIKKRLDLITKSDFRQVEILKRYKELLNNQSFLCVKMRAHVSAGTYIRSFCNDLGEYLGTNAISMEILRTRSGNFNLKDSITI